MSAAEACDGGEERPAEGIAASIPGGAPLLFPNTQHALLCPGLRQWRRGVWTKLIFLS